MTSVTAMVGKNEGLEENYRKLALEVMRGAIKSDGAGYLLTEGGQLWADHLGLEPSKLFNLISRKMSGFARTKSYRLSEFSRPYVYKSDRPKNCGKCGSKDLKHSSEEYEGIRDTFWVCDCGWEDAESTFSAESAIINIEAHAA